MVHSIRRRAYLAIPVALVLSVFAVLLSTHTTYAQFNPLPTPPPKPGSYGLEATKTKEPPTTAARITIPGNNASFAEAPITVRGIAPDGLMVQVYNNGVLVGSVMSSGGSFEQQVSLFAGTNVLYAIVYDELDQAGPVSNEVSIEYTNTDFQAFGEQITLTSAFGRRSAAVNSELTWPLQLSGGSGPYAFSIDWGDGSEPQLLSQAAGGVINISHVYKNAGIYQVNIRVTDVNGVSAFLQLVAVANGRPDASTSGNTDGGGDGSGGGSGSGQQEVLWIPSAASLAMLPPAFILGRMSQVVSLRNKMLKEHENVKKNR